MATTFDEAGRRLDGALVLLEAAVARRLEAERRRGDLETELQIMQDDRAQLAVELDGTVARLHRVEAASEDVSRRIQNAMGAVRDVLARADEEA